MERVYHPFPPVYDVDSRVLILGSFPSVKSREGEFYYHHPQNRFWKVLSRILDEPLPLTIEEKKAVLLRNKVALWDVILSCEITGSSDSSIKKAEPNDIAGLLEQTKIREIYANGGTAYRLYSKYVKPITGRDALKLPSTSPANAACSLERLIEEWSCIRNAINTKG
jgi:hypoxanthine-DNA glycosylase